MLNAFSSLLDMSPKDLADRLDHDGKACFPGTDIERTHHVQEIIDVAYSVGCYLMPIEMLPASFDPSTGQTFKIFVGDGTAAANYDRFTAYLKLSKGVIVGMLDSGIGHAVYWDGNKCVDGNGSWDLWADEANFAPGVYWRAAWIT